MSQRTEKVGEVIKQLTAEFIERENNRSSLITVTRADVSADLKNATVYVTVLPEEKEGPAIDFLKRKRREIKDYLKKNLSIARVPFVDIELDLGEKNRQRIDELSREANI